MSRIRSKNTSPELSLRKSLWKRGLRYRCHARVCGIRPDLVFVGPRVVVFVDGCFWHGCPDHYVRPRTRTRFWQEKLRRNTERDRLQTELLEAEGWTVLRIWEHEVFEELAQAASMVVGVVNRRNRRQARIWRVVRVDPVRGSKDLEVRHMECLRDPARRKKIRTRRSTRKWKRGIVVG